MTQGLHSQRSNTELKCKYRCLLALNCIPPCTAKNRAPQLQGTYKINRQDRVMLAGKPWQAGKDLLKITNMEGPLQSKCTDPNPRAILCKMYSTVSVAL